MKRRYLGLIIALVIATFTLLCSNKTAAQNANIVIYGNIVDVSTNVPLSDATVYFNKGRGARSDSSGYFILRIPRAQAKSILTVDMVGYQSRTVDIDPSLDSVDIGVLDLTQAASNLKNVVVTDKKKKYRNKNNPAVELIRQVIEHKDENQMSSYESAQYNTYEKLVASISNLSSRIHDKKMFQKYKFLLEQVMPSMTGAAAPPSDAW